MVKPTLAPPTLSGTAVPAASANAPWRALTDHREFGEWFRVKLDAPLLPGQVSRGHITYPGYEHLSWEATVQKMEPERLLSFTWHPYAVDPASLSKSSSLISNVFLTIGSVLWRD
jgi:uncharacterized protein YndB with AHSA1/START domain